MKSTSEPLVSVLTPVYNGEKYLAECIESVLVQTYKNWEYVIVNNCSTDGTLRVAEQFARRDSRIHVCTNGEFFPVVKNWNHALRQISGSCKYVKEVHADDWLFPECLSEMVKVAETNPSVGIVGAYRLEGYWIKADGLPYPSPLVPGREICRSFLLGGPYVFGSPTSVLIRSDLIRKRDALYNDEYLNPDTEAYFDLLQDCDFGFVHQILTCTRLHDESITSSVSRRLDAERLGLFHLLVRYGPVYLNNEEYQACLKTRIRNYYKFLFYNLFRRRGKDFWDYHRTGLAKLGYPISWISLAKISLYTVIEQMFNPRRIVEGVECLARESIANVTRGQPGRKGT